MMHIYSEIEGRIPKYSSCKAKWYIHDAKLCCLNSDIMQIIAHQLILIFVFSRIDNSKESVVISRLSFLFQTVLFNYGNILIIINKMVSQNLK